MAEIKNIFDSWEEHTHTEVENALKRTIASLQGENYSQIAVNIPGALNRTFVATAERVTFFYKVDNTVDGTYIPDFKVEIIIGDNVITLTDVGASSADDKIETPNLIPYLTQVNKDVIVVKIKAYTNYGFPSTVKSIEYTRKEQEDDFSINLATNIIKEGTSEYISINTNSDITHSSLKWKYDFSNFVIDGDISEQNIKDRIRVNNGYLTVDNPRENASWSVKLTLTAYPSYYLEEEFNNIPTSSKPNIELNISAIKIEDLSISTKSEVPINSQVEVSVSPIPADSTKLKGVNYIYSTTTPDILDIKTSNQGTTITAKKEGTANLVVRLFAYNNTVTISKSTTIKVYSLRPVVFIIDQRYLNNLKDPEGMVSENYMLNSDGSLTSISDKGATGDPNNNTLTWLRQNTHSYVSRCLEDGSVRLKQLSDTSRKTFADGSSATSYISNESGEFDVFLKFGSDIYYKTEAWIPEGQSEPDLDYIAVTIATKIPSNEDASKWCKWSQYKLIGVYKACRINEKFYSLSGKKPIIGVSQSTCIAKAKARGANFNICDYDMTKLFAFLFYGYYSSLGCQQICGYGTINTIPNSSSYFPKITGSTDGLNMTDTDTTTGNGPSSPNELQIQRGIGTDIKTVNFWGLEGYWGDISEWISNLSIMHASNKNGHGTMPQYYVTDYIAKYNSVIVTKPTGIDVTYTSKDSFVKDYPNSDSKFLAIYNSKSRYIIDSDNNIIRLIDINTTSTLKGYIKKMMFGAHADIIAKAYGNGASTDTGFTDYSRFNTFGSVARRAGRSNEATGGVGFLEVWDVYGPESGHTGARLIYDGDASTVHVIDDAIEEL